MVRPRDPLRRIPQHGVCHFITFLFFSSLCYMAHRSICARVPFRHCIHRSRLRSRRRLFDPHHSTYFRTLFVARLRILHSAGIRWAVIDTDGPCRGPLSRTPKSGESTIIIICVVYGESWACSKRKHRKNVPFTSRIQWGYLSPPVHSASVHTFNLLVHVRVHCIARCTKFRGIVVDKQRYARRKCISSKRRILGR